MRHFIKEVEVIIMSYINTEKLVNALINDWLEEITETWFEYENNVE